MGGSTWVQNKTELFEGELVVFQRANSPNYYMRVYVAKESKHYQKSLRTKSQYEAIERAKDDLNKALAFRAEKGEYFPDLMVKEAKKVIECLKKIYVKAEILTWNGKKKCFSYMSRLCFRLC